MSTYGIRTLSQTLKIPASTLRYYEEIGLLIDVARDLNGQRIYTDVHIARLEAIKCFRDTGLPIAKMNAFFHYEEDLEENISSIISLVAEHEETIEQQIELLQKNLAHIKHKVWYYNAIKEAMEENKALPQWDEYPDK